jgi:hypothetical protein
MHRFKVLVFNVVQFHDDACYLKAKHFELNNIVYGKQEHKLLITFLIYASNLVFVNICCVLHTHTHMVSHEMSPNIRVVSHWFILAQKCFLVWVKISTGTDASDTYITDEILIHADITFFTQNKRMNNRLMFCRHFTRHVYSCTADSQNIDKSYISPSMQSQ